MADAVEDAGLPLALRLLDGARQSIEAIERRVLGEDFETRIAELAAYYEHLGGDPFGLDLQTARAALRVCAYFHRLYFRTVVEDVDRVPQGRVIIVSNHGGQVPVDAALIGCGMLLDAPSPRIARAMVDRWVGSLPFVSTFFMRVGQVPGLPDNARRLLEREEAILTFPEGIRAIAKPFRQRYQLRPFSHGFVRLALLTQAPVVPVAVLGTEEQYISLGNLERVARTFKMPVFPLVPQLLLPGGQLPLPTRCRVCFGDPMFLEGRPDDDEAVAHQAWLVKEAVHHLVRCGLAKRRSVFW
jgi:1-acyl-sn-glycerol-3-phosphate acyltransferase